MLWTFFKIFSILSKIYFRFKCMASISNCNYQISQNLLLEANDCINFTFFKLNISLLINFIIKTVRRRKYGNFLILILTHFFLKIENCLIHIMNNETIVHCVFKNFILHTIMWQMCWIMIWTKKFRIINIHSDKL